jgi:hypothetical protein
MADPVTMMIVAGGMQVAQGIQSYQQNRAMAQATKAETSANIANQQEAFKVNKSRLVREQEQLAGKQTVAAAGSGATLGSFDPLFGDTAQQSSLDLALLEYDKNLNIANTAYQGQMKKKAYYREGRSQLLAGITKAAQTGAGAASPSGFGANASKNSAGQTIGAQFSSSPQGPYLNYGSRTMSGY